MFDISKIRPKSILGPIFLSIASLALGLHSWSLASGISYDFPNSSSSEKYGWNRPNENQNKMQQSANLWTTLYSCFVLCALLDLIIVHSEDPLFCSDAKLLSSSKQCSLILSYPHRLIFIGSFPSILVFSTFRLTHCSLGDVAMISNV